MLIALSVVLGIRWMRHTRPSAKAAFVVALSGLFLAVTMLVVDDATDGKGPLSLIQAKRDDGDLTTFTGRTFLWSECISFVAERPFTGFGYGAFWSPTHIEDVSHEFGWAINQSHSAYIDQSLSGGVPGALLYVAALTTCLGVSISRLWRGKEEYTVWTALVLFLIFHGFTESLSLLPLFPNFVANIILFKVALSHDVVRKETPKAYVPVTT